MARVDSPFKSALLAPHKSLVPPQQTASWVNYLIVPIIVILAIFLIFKRQALPKIKASKTKRPERSINNELGSSDLASREQILGWTKTSPKLDTLMPVSEVRGSQGVAIKRGNLCLPNDQRNRHMLIIAKTGSGKTQKLILPVLYNDCMCPDRSTIVIDSKPEMWQKLAAMTKYYNPKKKLILFNPLDKLRSLSWNILAKIEDDTDAKLISNTIIAATDQPGAKQDTPFFRNNALQLLNAIMVGILEDPNEKLSMPRVHQIIHSGVKGLCDWLEAHPSAIRSTRTFVDLVRSGSQNADTIMSELSMRLSAWDISAIRGTTFYDEIDLESLIQEPTLFIVELRESEIEMLRPLANVIVVELLRFMTKRAERCQGLTLPRPVSIVIDEFASAVGRLPDIHIKLNTLRSRNVSIVAAIQSIGQLKGLYEDKADSVIAGFSTKILMPAMEFMDADWASKESGQMTIRFKTGSTGSSKRLVDVWTNTNSNIQEHVQQRQVLTPGEVGNPPDGACTFFMPNTPVFQGNLIPWYQIPEMKERFDKFENQDTQLQLREAPLEFDEAPLNPLLMHKPAEAAASADAALTPEEIQQALGSFKCELDWTNTMDIAREWWEAFEKENQSNMLLVLTVAHELVKRKATINEFFLAYVYSNSDNIQENLDYMDKRRKMTDEEKAEEAAKASAQHQQKQAPQAEAA